MIILSSGCHECKDFCEQRVDTHWILSSLYILREDGRSVTDPQFLHGFIGSMLILI